MPVVSHIFWQTQRLYKLVRTTGGLCVTWNMCITGYHMDATNMGVLFGIFCFPSIFKCYNPFITSTSFAGGEAMGCDR